MKIIAAIPPDWGDHSWRPLVLSTRTAAARYTTRPEWSSDGESMWMRLSKFSLCNRLSLRALASLVAAQSDETGCASVDLRHADRFALSRLASLLEIPHAAALAGFCLPSAHPTLAWAATELRYCPKCLERGFHAAWFQWQFIERCPVHGSRLRGGCRKCAAVIPYALDSSMAMHPLSCAQCGTSWVPVLNRPAGRCVPAKGWLARVFRRWQIHVVDAMMSVTATPPRPRDPATGRFAPQWAISAEIRMTSRARCLQLLNQLYEVPPPSLAEFTDWRCTQRVMAANGRIVSLAGEDWETDAMPWARADWPHVGEDFLEYEQLLKHVEHTLFGDTRRIACMRSHGTHHHDAIVAHTRDMSADQATALGWSISWYGFARACAPGHEPCLPAVGLLGWLAHAPHRPVEVSPERWRGQMCAWLAQDLARSAWAWSRIVLFMRARGEYLLHGQLVRPSDLAHLRQL
ncbi:hypothetical protein LBW62_19855 [Ralstonia solanacearum]|uniref:hypothetical protein n=1 Tax=Ralstonia solanacearum TaxID=305 RepID=UPI000AC1C5FB|nr:hypothetical protein [Ralstonia solanacearum]MDB0543488.1 hypothetical protein [Ralstonia solanacearum]MDB0553594.1 hypothetical protein [Ralstonia solanacearum]MDB0558439.1 hypothetical protein [Ralstonia solanacearum]